MVELSDIISVSEVACNVEVSSKKKALHKLSQMLSEAINGAQTATHGNAAPDTRAAEIAEEDRVDEMDILDALISRERLGSTALGQGIALPHGRLVNLERSVAAMITLSNGTEFDAPDDQPVDIVFALLVPEASTDEHLKILGTMAERFSDEKVTAELRECTSEENNRAHIALCGEPDKADH